MTRADDWRWGMVPQPLASARSATPAARFAHHRLPIRQTRNRCHILVATVGRKPANYPAGETVRQKHNSAAIRRLMDA